MRDGFIFYASFYDAINDLSDADQLTAYRAVCEYALTGNEPELSGVASAIFKLIKPQIDANNRRRENGKRGGRPKSKTEPESIPEETEEKPKENQNITEAERKEKEKGKVKDKVKEKVKEKESSKRFAPPTIDDVKAYASEKGYVGFQADRFIDYYESNGWMVGRNKMKDWKAAVRSWHSRDRLDNNKPKGATKFSNFEQRTDSLDEMMRKGMLG